MTMSRMLTLSALTIVSGASLSGCAFIQQKISEKVNETIVETATGGKLDIDTSENQYTITTEEGGSLTVGSQDISAITDVVKLPDWITAASNSGVMSSESDGKRAVYGSLVSSKPVQETNVYWEQYFTAEGYQEVTKADYAGTKMISGSKGAGDTKITLAVTISNSTEDNVDGTQVVIVYSGPLEQK